MKKLSFDKNNQAIIKKDELSNYKIDIKGRDIIIGFNEPSLKFSKKSLEANKLDSKLNARLISYFLPAVEIAKMQKKRPRLYIVSGLNMALKWNASNEKEKKIMMIDNNLKFDFLKTFFENFFPDAFSVIEFIVVQDPLKIPEEKLFSLWKRIEKNHPNETQEIKLTLARFKRPKLFNTETLSEEANLFLNSQNMDLINALKYAVSHLFALGDVNFEGNYIHNPTGYLSIGGEQEKIFNKVRNYAHEILRDFGELIFEREIILKNNLKLILESKEKVPPAYNGAYRYRGDRKLELDEVTYENKRTLDFYDSHKKLKFEMQYIYKNFISKDIYENFWKSYEKKYFDLKSRYREAYRLEEDF